MRRPTVVDDVADKLAYRIAAGVYAPGDPMPSVRQVAAEFQISAPTANAILGRLAAAGFADARRGLGHTVRDVRLYGGIESWRPEAAEAFYGPAGPGLHVMIWQDLLGAWERGADTRETDIVPYEQIIGDYHAQVVRRFRALVADVPAGHPAAAGATLDVQ